MKTQFYIAQTSSVDTVIQDILSSVEQGYSWGSTIGIGLTAGLLAIALIQFLYDRN